MARMISLTRIHAGILLFLNAAAVTLVGAEPLTTVVVETPGLRFAVNTPVSGFELVDKKSGASWKSNPWTERFGEVSLKVGGQSRNLDLKGGIFAKNGKAGGSIVFHPLANDPNATLT